MKAYHDLIDQIWKIVGVDNSGDLLAEIRYLASYHQQVMKVIAAQSQKVAAIKPKKVAKKK